MSLRVLLTASRLPTAIVVRRFESVALWPAAPSLAAPLTRHRSPPEDLLQPGEAWLIAVHEAHKRGSLWRLRVRPEGHAAEFVDTAREELQRAMPRALGAMPITPRVPSPRGFPRPLAQLVRAANEDVGATSVRGRSFGLAMLLAAAARILDRTMPSALLVSATVDDAGCVGRVDDLDEKIDFVVEYALGITRLMVHTSQARHARARIDLANREGRLHGRTIAVLGVETACAAIDAVFPDIEDVLAVRWSTPAEADAAARALWEDLVRGDRHTSRWQSVVRAAEILAERVSPEARWRVDWIHAIARRHTGAPDARIAWPDDDALGRERPDTRWLVLSQLLQSAADHTTDDATADAYLARSEREVNAWAEACPDGRRFLGARGRALAALGRCDEAARDLEAAVEGWFRGGEREITEASFALSELLRVRGFVGAPEDVERALAWADHYALHAEETGENRGEPWVRHARARCLALRGRLLEARSLLAATMPDTLEPSQRRWHARVLDALGATEAADAVRASITGDESAWREAAALAALDHALARDADHHAALRAFDALGDPGAELRRMLRQRGLTADRCEVAQAREIADRFRY